LKLYVIRHGETVYNLQKKIQGQIENSLTEKGIAQSHNVKKVLKDVKIDEIICSPLERTKYLAEVINEGRNLQIKVDSRITERSYGELEGKKPTGLNFESFWKLSSDLDKECKKNHVETLHDFFNRVQDFLEECEKNYKDKNICVVTHSGISIAIEYYFNKNSEDLLKLRMDNGEIKVYERGKNV